MMELMTAQFEERTEDVDATIAERTDDGDFAAAAATLGDTTSDEDSRLTELADAIRNNINVSLEDGTTETEFIMFGDLLDVVLGSENVNKWLSDSDVRVVLGTFAYQSIREGRRSNFPLGLIPISIELFSIWFLEEIVEKDVTTLTMRQFVRSVFDKLVSNAFGRECAYDPAGEISLPQENFSVIPEYYTIPYHSMARVGLIPRITDDAGVPSLNLGQPNYPGLGNVGHAYIDGQLEGRGLLDNPRSLAAQNKPVNVVLYQGQNREASRNQIFDIDLTPSPGPPMSGGPVSNTYVEQKERDAANGIYHLRMGNFYGMIKNIQYERIDQPYAREARIEAAGELGSYMQLRERYNAKVSMWGSAQYYPGQYVYLNPSFYEQGSIPSLQSVTTLIGIGGYFLITKVENIIEKGEFETILTCKWVYSGFRVEDTTTATLQQRAAAADAALNQQLANRTAERAGIIAAGVDPGALTAGDAYNQGVLATGITSDMLVEMGPRILYYTDIFGIGE